MGDPSLPREAGEPFVDWRAVWAGAVVAAGISLTLLAFGSAIGLSVASTAPTWRETSPWLWLLSGVFLVFVALCSFGFGGYLTGRMRTPSLAGDLQEAEFRDSMHGVCTWGLSILVAAILALGSLAVSGHLTAPTGGAGASVVGETTIATELDELFRTYRPTPVDNMEYRRAEAARILMKSGTKAGVLPEDRDYLAGLVSQRTGLGHDEATNRVDVIIAHAKDSIHKARVAAVLQAFLIAAASLLGAAVASFAAVEGGRFREQGTVPIWTSPFRRTTTPL